MKKYFLFSLVFVACGQIFAQDFDMRALNQMAQYIGKNIGDIPDIHEAEVGGIFFEYARKISDNVYEVFEVENDVVLVVTWLKSFGYTDFFYFGYDKLYSEYDKLKNLLINQIGEPIPADSEFVVWNWNSQPLRLAVLANKLAVSVCALDYLEITQEEWDQGIKNIEETGNFTGTVTVTVPEWEAEKTPAGFVITAYTGNDRDVQIPEQINEIPVVGIGNGVFARKDLTKVTIPDSVTSIGIGAFWGTYLEDIVIPNNVRFIDQDAFLMTSGLLIITIPADVTIKLNTSEIRFVSDPKSDAFVDYYNSSGKRAGTYAYVDDEWYSAVRQIQDGNFNVLIVENRACILHYTGNEKSVHIPDAFEGYPVTTIMPSAFWNKGLTDINIPDTVTGIGSSAFSKNELSNVMLPDNLLYIDGLAFSANKLSHVTIPNNVFIIGMNAFRSNELTSVVISNNITSLEEWPFFGNVLTNITIPADVALVLRERLFDMHDEQDDFVDYYNSNGKKAGTYTLDDGQWNYRAR
jgi:hypothetical protein